MNYESFDITRSRDYERTLQRVATRGIVQLFNTVRKQQQQQKSSSVKKDNTTINKGEFLDMLKTIDSDETSYKILNKNQSTVNIKRINIYVSVQYRIIEVFLEKTSICVWRGSIFKFLMASMIVRVRMKQSYMETLKSDSLGY